MKEIYICPHCKQNLKKENNSYICPNRHCFDISKNGYVNLLPVNEKHNLNPGDNELMCNSRQNFLQKEYYLPLANKINEILQSYNRNEILDAGCGTGYYINKIQIQNCNSNCYGIDISKCAINKASKQNKNINFAVSSIFNMPFNEKSFDVILNIFAPKPTLEFKRVLKDDGIILEVVPNKNHLIELRQLLYTDEKLRNQKEKKLENFILKESTNLTYIMNIKNNEDLINLFLMTPYEYKTKLESKLKLQKIENIKITADFVIKTWKKEQK